MIQGLFDNNEEKPSQEREEEKKPETRVEENNLPEDEISLEIPGMSETENADEREIKNYSFPILAEISSFPVKENVDNLTSPEPADLRESQTVVEPTMPSGFSDFSAEPKIFSAAQEKTRNEPALFSMQSDPESTAETARKSGLAMSAAIALFGSVVFCLIIGWFADLLLGTSPCGIVGGIVLGSVLGFFQFFRMTSQILKK